jgi:hypothetical protein
MRFFNPCLKISIWTSACRRPHGLDSHPDQVRCKVEYLDGSIIGIRGDKSSERLHATTCLLTFKADPFSEFKSEGAGIIERKCYGRGWTRKRRFSAFLALFEAGLQHRHFQCNGVNSCWPCGLCLVSVIRDRQYRKPF